jgi:hypothetical protein
VLGEQAGLVGCAVTVLDQVLAADAVDRELARLAARAGDGPDRRAAGRPGQPQDTAPPRTA